MEKVKVGIIGCGMITRQRHGPEYSQNPNAEIIGFYDADKERREELAALYSAKAYDSVEALLADEEINAVSICSPNSTHAEYSIKAMKAGKNVLCEKPIALSMEDSREMLRISEETGKMLMLGHNQRLLATYQKAKELLDTGAIGRLLSFQSNFKHQGPESWSITKSNATWFFDKNQAHFGALGDLGAHKLDIIRYLTSQEVKDVSATVMTLDKKDPEGNLIQIEDNAMVLFKMNNGLPGIMHVSWTNYGAEDNSTIFYGDKGSMKIFGGYMDDIVLEMRDGSVVKCSVGSIQTNEKQTKSGIIDEFVGALTEERAPLISGIDGHNTIATIVACFKSANENKWVPVEY